MPSVEIRVNGRPYAVSCDAGKEEHIKRLAAYIDEKVKELAKSIGQVGESRLLLLAGLTLADELAETYDELASARARAEPAAIPDPASARATAEKASAADARARAAEAKAAEAAHRAEELEASVRKTRAAEAQLTLGLTRIAERLESLAETAKR